MNQGNKKAVVLTEGNIWKQLLLFSLPILFGNVFQQTYNMVDSVIVGRFVGDDALAAVGSSSNIIHLLLSAFFGISMGAGVVIAKYYGAKDWEGVSRGVHTMVAFGLTGGILFTVLGELLTPHILQWIGTPEEVMVESQIYFRIFFVGTIFSSMYNIGSGILRAVGDSRRPLYYLIYACIINVVLDLLFVAVFEWGVAGAAWATVIAQGFKFLLIMRALTRKNEVYCVSWRKLRFHKEELKAIVAIGLPSGLQNSIVSISNIVVQSSINSFGALALAGYGAYSKIDGFAMMPASAFAMATTTFVGQNIGAKNFDRVKKGAKTGLFLNMITAESIGILLAIIAPFLLRIFTDDPQIIAYGALQASICGPFYCLCAGSHAMAGMLRGAGKSTIPMMVIILFWCGLRMSWITFVARPIHIVDFVFYAYPITWACSFIVLGIYCLKSGWIKKAERAALEA